MDREQADLLSNSHSHLCAAQANDLLFLALCFSLVKQGLWQWFCFFIGKLYPIAHAVWETSWQILGRAMHTDVNIEHVID